MQINITRVHSYQSNTCGEAVQPRRNANLTGIYNFWLEIACLTLADILLISIVSRWFILNPSFDPLDTNGSKLTFSKIINCQVKWSIWIILIHSPEFGKAKCSIQLLHCSLSQLPVGENVDFSLIYLYLFLHF